MKVKQAIEAGKISKGNGKMPGTTFAVDAFACVTGSKLAKIKGTACHRCYARGLQRIRPSVDKGYKLNLAKWQASNPEEWISSMVFQLERYCTDGHHRWFDSGDLQSPEMFRQICEVARRTPGIKHWLPTQERGFVRAGRALHGQEPSNLAVRVSASKVDAEPPSEPLSSTVFSKRQPAGFECQAKSRGNKCGPCRACWDTDVQTVSYPLK